MSDANSVRDDPSILQHRAAAAERAEQIERKTGELSEFRDAGVLTEAEFEEQKAKLRWGIS
ncbi:MAG: SHOCT domain-containing protein [Actinomycetota bacterium]|nr:SHOCT domain-containing protein [Actinomycetota bacterium]